MHEGAYRFVADAVKRIDMRWSVIELGSRTVAGDWPYSGPVRPLFNVAEYVGVDIAEGPNVDVIANAAQWRPNDHPLGECFDTVVCCETLEHAPEAEMICLNAWQLLKEGGVLLTTMASEGRAPHSAVDGGPLRDGEFYRNVSRDQLRKWLTPFTFILIDTDTPTDIYALAVK
jgi:hypothetical protein